MSAACSGLIIGGASGCGGSHSAQPPPPKSVPRAGAPAQPPPTAPPPASPSDAEAVVDALTRAGVRTPPLRVIGRWRWGALLGFEVRAQQAEAEWARIRAVSETSGFYPVILIGAISERWLEDLRSINEASTPDGVVAASSRIDAASWLRDREASMIEDAGDAPRGEFRCDDVPDRSFSLVDFKGRPKQDVWIALFPTPRGWEVPAYLAWGGWNACPNPEENVAVLRYWNERQGADLMIMTMDVIELRVARPVTDRDTAYAVAHEQFAYTSGDDVFQGMQTLDALAAGIYRAKVWYFWWD